MQQRVLLIEDDEDISRMVSSYLAKEGYEVEQVFDGEAAERKVRSGEAYDLVLLDLMLPRRSGMDVLQSIRAASLVPVLIMSAKDSDVDKALGLGFGADDYITKPFSMIELAARVKAAIRRAGYAAAGAVRAEEPPAAEAHQAKLIPLRGLTVNLDTFSAEKHGEEVKLTAKEFQILRLFAANPGRVYTKAQIYSLVWEDDYYGDENVINVHMRRLREKIEDDPSHPEYIKTLWGIGYKLGDVLP
ncbi:MULTISPECIES: response regulator transcription factor [unclassified Paenibacillus]|uniref:response regulator transcription factor n=1 Tax=unclassified Paenibacillus TaxID=185978 RepID=UPI002404B139|nr:MULTISPECIES: response regulator transcription factor [unclassified Paenibacillus]MDF9841787.1 two-component system response regulator VicR [Paenibacillus sp. PastF-2]MDF9848532.1 two-component system response regulator VicR [Paenibacillus sp. PastM-2]MDF9854947.1 two-component system response regulator VicR [Paenibacillus sp. PastF-1]MDH6480216.1 two-component system response regulator VicR [Paenibacillus sp. PastH-2]MDH6507800.1 two-component system response regulator VicR [Paenibacillus 